MSCESCPNNQCERRDVKLLSRLGELCATDTGYAKLLDEQHGVVNPAIVPESVTLAETAIVSQIGTRLKEIIERDEEEVVTCPDCLREIERLNRMTQREARNEREQIIAAMVKRADIVAPKLWQRLAIKVDRTLGTGQVAEKIGAWVDEAIDTGELVKKKKTEPPDQGLPQDDPLLSVQVIGVS